MKEKLAEFLELDRRKIILALLIPYLWNLFTYGLVFLISLTGETVLLPPFNLMLRSQLSKAPILLLESVFYYFFACSIVIIYDYRKIGKMSVLKKEKGLYRMVIIGLLVFNPITLNILSQVFLVTMFFTQYGKVAPQMGLTILEVYPNTPAESMGLNKKTGRVIELIEYRHLKRIDGQILSHNVTKRYPSIDDAKGVLSYVDPNNPMDKIYVEILFGGGYQTHPTSKTLGIRIRDATGNEAIL